MAATFTAARKAIYTGREMIIVSILTVITLASYAIANGSMMNGKDCAEQADNKLIKKPFQIERASLLYKLFIA
jgi:hypothetical protein